MNTHKLQLKTNIKLCRKAKKFIHVTHIIYKTTDNHLFSWHYPELACKTKYICISKQENTIYIWYFRDETKNFFVRVFLEMRLRKHVQYAHVNSLILQSVKNFGRAE